MPLYAWKDEYSVGVTRFDNHHKKLFDIVNRLHDMMKDGRGGDQIEKTIRELVEYTRYHLAEEEKTMESIGYSDIDAHKRAHRIFTDKLDDAMIEVDQGKAIFVVIKLSSTIIDWLINHIFVIDQKYLPEMTAAGVK